MCRKLISLLLSALLVSPASATVSLSPTTTIPAQTQQNTSASPNFQPLNDTRVGIASPAYLPVPAVNVSSEPPTSLPYSGWNGFALVHVMGWFTSTGCISGNAGVGNWSHLRPARSGHWCIGYDSNSATQVHAEINDMIRRGYKGITYTWNGRYNPGTTTQKVTDQGINLIKADLEARCSNGSCPFYFLVMPDTSALTFGKTYGGLDAVSCCTLNTATDENNFIARIKDNYCYFNKFFWGSPAYLKVAGRPFAPNFMTETGRTATAAPSWADLWTNMQPFNANLQANCPTFNSIYVGAPNNGVPWQMFGTGNSAFTHDGLSNGPSGIVQGAYLWENGNNGGCGLGVNGQDCEVANALGSAGSFYSASLNYSPSESIGAAWPGFDDQNADWSPNDNGCAAGSYCTNAGRVFARNCGTTWINSWAKAGSYYSAAKQLPLIHVVTWSDYDEGTAIEPGIDNCYNITSSVAADGHTLSWSLSASDSRASLNTISHVTVYASLDCVNLGVLATGIAVSSTSGSIDLNTTMLSPGTYAIYVQMVGKNSIVNRWSRSATAFVVSPVIAPPPPPPPPPPPTPGGGGTPPPVPGIKLTPRFVPFTPPTFGTGGVTVL